MGARIMCLNRPARVRACVCVSWGPPVSISSLSLVSGVDVGGGNVQRLLQPLTVMQCLGPTGGEMTNRML